MAALNHPNIVTLHSLEEERRPSLPHHGARRRAGPSTGSIPPAGLPLEALLGYALPLARRAGGGAPARHRSSRPEAGQRDADARRPTQAARLRPRHDRRPANESVAPSTGRDAHRRGPPAGHRASTCRRSSSRARPLDRRSDVFALGVLLYELAAGRPPFGGATQAEMCSAILREQPPPCAPCARTCRRPLSDEIMRCLEKDPGRRFADAGEVHRELRAPDSLRGGSAGETASTGPARDAPPRLRRRSRCRRPHPSPCCRFSNLSADAENEYFADGITEDVIAHLSKIRSLKVISRTSVMSFKKREQSLREIGRDLGAGAMLEGSVRRAGNRVRIVAQLVDAETDEHLWAETYDRDLTDIFAIQTEVALQIAAALRAELSPARADAHTRGRRRTTSRPTSSICKGGTASSGTPKTVFAQGIGYFEQAIEGDPELRPGARGPGAGVRGAAATRGWCVTPEVALGRAKEAVATGAGARRRASGMRTASSRLLRSSCDFDWAGAEAEFKLALELSPGSADIYDHYGWMCSALERYDERDPAAEARAGARPAGAPVGSRDRRSCAPAGTRRRSSSGHASSSSIRDYARGHRVGVGLPEARPARRRAWRSSSARSRSRPRARMFLGQLGQALRHRGASRRQARDGAAAAA